MGLLDICETDLATRVQYVTLVAHMARIDGQLVGSEQRLLAEITEKFCIPKHMQVGIYVETQFEEDDISAIFLNLKNAGLQHSFILDLIAMALVDGVILDSEQMMLAQISGLIGLSNDEFYNLVNFSQATSALDVNTRIDPMYQYVIDAFFEWVKTKNIRLFKQTSLSVKESVDQFLKKDL